MEGNKTDAIFISLLHTGSFHAIAEVTRERVWLKSNARLNLLDNWRRRAFVDVEVIVNRMVIPVHSIVLAAHSKLLGQVISQSQAYLENCSEKVQVHLTEFSPHTVNKVLDFLYSGDLIYTESELPELRFLAQNLQLGYLQCQLDLLAKCSSSDVGEAAIAAGGSAVRLGKAASEPLETAANTSVGQYTAETQDNISFRSVFDDAFDDSQTRIIIDGFHEIEVEEGDLETPIQSPQHLTAVESLPAVTTAVDPMTAVTTAVDHPLTTAENNQAAADCSSPEKQPSGDISISDLFTTPNKDLGTINESDIKADYHQVAPSASSEYTKNIKMAAEFIATPLYTSSGNSDGLSQVVDTHITIPVTQIESGTVTQIPVTISQLPEDGQMQISESALPDANQVQIGEATGLPDVGSQLPGSGQNAAATKQVESDSSFKCDICKKGFTRSHQLKIHKRIHTGEKPYACTNCKKRFVDSSSLNKHAKIHQEEGSFKCNVCKKVFKNKSNLRQHLKTHIEERYYSCTICAKRFTYKRNLSRHIEIHDQSERERKLEKKLEKEKWSLCFLCDQSFPNPEELFDHLKKTHPEMAPLETFWRCGECNKVFPSEETLTGHREIVHQNILPTSTETEGENTENRHPVTNDQMICTCGISFGNLRTLRQHQKIYHNALGPYKCNFCSQGFKSNELLWKHMLEHHGKRRKHTCGYCSKSWEKASDLAKHIRIHTGEKPHQCKDCDQRFNDLSALRRHEGKHKTTILYQCDLCNKSFKVPHNLNKHKEMHKLAKYACNLCGKMFTEESSLRYHMNQHNGSLTPFNCDICDKQFKHSYDLKNHIRVHSKEKPYTCTVCAKSFSDLSSFRKHERTHEKAK